MIVDPGSGQAHNIVAAINVGPTYHARIASPVSKTFSKSIFLLVHLLNVTLIYNTQNYDLVLMNTINTW